MRVKDKSEKNLARTESVGKDNTSKCNVLFLKIN